MSFNQNGLDGSSASSNRWAPSPDILKEEIKGFLNSVLMLLFLMGIYTAVYGATLYFYRSTRKASQFRVILVMLTLSYALTWVVCGVQWHNANVTFVDYGDNRLSMFFRLYYPPAWLDVIAHTCQNIVVMLADGLLVCTSTAGSAYCSIGFDRVATRCGAAMSYGNALDWSCSFPWSSGLQNRASHLFFPNNADQSSLLLTYTALTLSVMILQIKHLTETDMQVNTLNRLTSALYFTSAGTSLVCTGLIASRIYKAYCMSDYIRQIKFKNVLDIIIQSSAIYTLSVLILGVIGAIPLSSNDSAEYILRIDNTVYYLGPIAIMMIGMMPTLMVARIFLENQKEILLSSSSASGSTKKAANSYKA
ncbi:hypothetical protein D9613_012702 [Agrocybe pediades]|uniref:Uncharacterized protein n=1 Tax=Agrocybe pediades TaxID=84607 RepID=A0A8H4QKI7_9AGAR|nr:hypothetical protein D9613_012702 [Agrocybe pediades]